MKISKDKYVSMLDEFKKNKELIKYLNDLKICSFCNEKIDNYIVHIDDEHNQIGVEKVMDKMQSDMTGEMQDSVCDFIIEGFRKKIEYEDIAKYIKDECDKYFGGEFIGIIVDKYGGFGSCLKCAPGSLFMGEYQNNRIILFRT